MSKPTVYTGLDQLVESKKWQEEVIGDFGYLCHAPSITRDYEIGVLPLQRIFKDRLKKLFSPQHGLVGDVQDNMIETKDSFHPFFKLPVHSLYSHTRIPTDEMLQGLQTLVVDLQDVGTRIYTYIQTLTLVMEKCRDLNIKVVVLDRPNPINGKSIEGNMLEKEYASFVGRFPLPTRHGLTIGEVAHFAKTHWGINCELSVIPMKGWNRDLYFDELDLPWVLPSPNLPTVEAAIPFVGTVLFEGTNISEGRGTTRSLEIVGHPGIEPYAALKSVESDLKTFNCEQGVKLRPLHFMPTFQKHQGISCGGFQIHITDRNKARPWAVSQVLCRFFYSKLGSDFQWKQPPYEYEYERLPIDLINGNQALRHWVETQGNLTDLQEIEQKHRESYLEQRKNILIY